MGGDDEPETGPEEHAPFFASHGPHNLNLKVEGCAKTSR